MSERTKIREATQAALEYAAELLADRRHEQSAPDALMEMRHEVADWVMRAMEEAAQELRGEGETAPAAGEDVRERVRQAVRRGIQEAWERYNRIYEPYDPGDESLKEWVDCITEQVMSALLRAPRGEGEVWRDFLAALDEFETAANLWVHPDGPTAEDVERLRQTRQRVIACARALAALRSEAQGEGWQVTEPARDIVRREMPETRATVREAIRAARRGEGGGE